MKNILLTAIISLFATATSYCDDSNEATAKPEVEVDATATVTDGDSADGGTDGKPKEEVEVSE